MITTWYVLFLLGPAPTVATSQAQAQPSRRSNEAVALLCIGKNIDVSSVVNTEKKFRRRGGIKGAIDAIKNLEAAGLGKLQLKSSHGEVKVSFLIER